MPEGDTLHKVAAYLRPRLLGRRLRQAQLARASAPLLLGREVVRVDSVGKHLLIGVAPQAGGWVLRVHLGMTGSWHGYAPGERWRLSPARASVVLETATDVWICFDADAVELVEADGLTAPTAVLGQLGPDLLGEQLDVDEVLRRAQRRSPAVPLLDLLLDQRVAAGIGNVYKCELLFLFGLPPMLPRCALSEAELRALYGAARRLLMQNRGGWRRTTTYDRSLAPAGRGGPRLWVYNRGGEPCLRCERPLAQANLGRHSRLTTWCPHCQAHGAPRPAPLRPDLLD